MNKSGSDVTHAFIQKVLAKTHQLKCNQAFSANTLTILNSITYRPVTVFFMKKPQKLHVF